MQRNLCLLGIILVAFPLCLNATKGRLKYELDTAKTLSQYTLDRWSIEDGLPSNTVKAQIKDQKGYIWLATYDGLVRFDGARFKTYNQRNNPQFPTNSLFDLLEDRQGDIWIATNGGGVLKKSGESFSLIPHNKYLTNKSITALCQDREGQIWVGTRGGLALIRNDEYVSFPELERLRNLQIHSLYVDSRGSLWVGTVGEGLLEINHGLVRHYSSQHGLTNQSICSIKEDSKGRLWIGTEDGLNMMENGRIKAMRLFKNPLSTFINDILEDSYGTLWLATNDGLIRYKNGYAELLLTDPEGGANELLNLYADGEGSMWIGSYFRGFLRLRDGKFRNYSRAEGLPSEVVSVVWPEHEGIWIGTNGGISFLRHGIERVYLLDNTPAANRILDIYRDSKGILWVATNDGLFQLKGQQFVRSLGAGSGLSSNKIRRILEDKEGSLWIATRSGLFIRKADRPQEVTVVDELSGVFILSIFLDSKGILWIGTNGKGLYRYDGSRFQNFNMDSGLSSDVLFDIWEDKEGNLWVGSNDGVNVFRNGAWHYLNEAKGFFSNTIFQMFSDGMDNLWITTNRGIFLVKRNDLLDVVDQKVSQIRTFKQFTSADGMRSSEITAVSKSRAAADGTLWFATLNGVSAINPTQIATNHHQPQMLIEKVTGDKQEHSLKERIIFPAGTRQYEIQYTAFNYYAPRATTFSYMLEGFDKEWQEAGNRRVAYYTNLPAGLYTFKVRAVNEDGVVSQEDAQLVLQQGAYFWETVWFKGAASSILLFAVLLLYAWRTRHLKKENQKLEQLVGERTNHIINQKQAIEEQKEELASLNHKKDKILSVLSHDLRQPFSSIAGLLALLREKQINQDEFQHFSCELNQQVKWQMHMLDNVLLWTRNQLKGLEVNPVSLNLHQLVEDVQKLYRSQASFKSIAIVNTIVPATNITADPDILHLVLRNLVGNAIKFTQENGTVTISAIIEKKVCRIVVADTGTGIERRKLEQLFSSYDQKPERGTSNEKGAGLGLILCKEFLEASGGKIWAESQTGKGSRFTFELPLYQGTMPKAHTLETVPANV